MRIFFVVNSTRVPRRTEARLRRYLPGYAVDVGWTSAGLDATRLAWRASRAGADTVVAVGGDGTVAAVVAGILGTRAALGVIPRGTANDFAARLGLSGNLKRACDTIVQGRLLEIDLILANGRPVVSSLGFGLAAVAAGKAHVIKERGAAGTVARRLLGSLVYVLGALYALIVRSGDGTTVELSSRDQTFSLDIKAMVAANVPVVGRFFHFIPRANMCDGRLDLCCFEHRPGRWRLFCNILRSFRGRHVNRTGVRIVRAPSVTISGTGGLPLSADGEPCLPADHWHLCVLPRGLKVAVPSLSDGVPHAA